MTVRLQSTQKLRGTSSNAETALAPVTAAMMKVMTTTVIILKGCEWMVDREKDDGIELEDQEGDHVVPYITGSQDQKTQRPQRDWCSSGKSSKL